MKIWLPISVVVFVLMLFLTCGTAPKARDGGVVEIQYGEERQEIDGFGGSDAWCRVPSGDEAADKLIKLLFSKTEGMGFTILRNRIPFRERLNSDDIPAYNDGFIVRKPDNTYDYTENADGTKTFNLNWNSWDISHTRNLIARIKGLGDDGPERLVIMSTPWTPPNNRVTQWKEDVVGVSTQLDYAMNWNTPDMWGRLKKDKYNDYADLLADYAGNFEAKMGAPLDILSVQNEPNWKVEYESAYWSGTDIRDFIKVIGQRFPLKGIKPGAGGLGIMAPEYENFNVNFNEMIKPTLDDPAANVVLTHIGLHQYNGATDPSTRAGSKEFPEIIESGKRFWQTEVSGSGPNLPPGNGMDNALYYARMIHYDMTLAETNAFLFWWLWGGSPNDAGRLISLDEYEKIETTTRLYVMGQYSRFIRPGWKRLAATTSPTRGVYSSAYRNPQTDEIAVVLINDSNSAVQLTINLPGMNFIELNSWRTSDTEKLKGLGRQRFNGGAADAYLPYKSVTTFYGRVSQ